MNKPLNKQLGCRWFETPARSCDVTVMCEDKIGMGTTLAFQWEKPMKYVDKFNSLSCFVLVRQKGPVINVV